MLRAAISNSRSRFFAASLSVTITGSAAAVSTLHKSKQDPHTFHINGIPFQGGTTQCSANQTIKGTKLTNNDKTAVEIMKDPSTQDQTTLSETNPFLSLIPTLQATNRGRRLIQTVVLMIMDYEKAKLTDSEFMKTIRYIETFAQDFLQLSPNQLKNQIKKVSEKEEDTCNIENQQTFWEEEFNKRKNNLEKAQHDYTSEPREEDVTEWAKLHIPDDSSSPKEKVCAL